MNLLSEKELEMQNPIQEALANWEQLKSDYEIAQDQIKELSDCNGKILAEVDYLRQTLQSVTTERNRYQRYCIDLTTRLHTIKDTIVNVEVAASNFAIKSPTSDDGPGFANNIIIGEDKRIPKNDYQ